MRSLRTLRIAAGVLIATGGAVMACYNEVPGPQGPLPSPVREAPPMGPTPTSPLPPAHLAPAPDGGIGVPMETPAKISVPIAVRVAAADEGSGSGSGSATPTPAKPDAGVDSAADLPAEVPDAGRAVVTDAGQPLRK